MGGGRGGESTAEVWGQELRVWVRGLCAHMMPALCWQCHQEWGHCIPGVAVGRAVQWGCRAIHQHRRQRAADAGQPLACFYLPY